MLIAQSVIGMPSNFLYFMEKSEIGQIVYDKRVIDFVTIAVEVCVFLEKEELPPRAESVDKLLKLLSLLYVKALLLPETIASDDDFTGSFVKEEDYLRVSNAIARVMGEEDVYLDVFMEDMKYSDTPVSSFISENIADIYQDIRNFVSVYQLGLTAQMNDALYLCEENFRLYWGQKLVNVLRPLHALKYVDLSDEDDLNNDVLEDELLWD